MLIVHVVFYCVSSLFIKWNECILGLSVVFKKKKKERKRKQTNEMNENIVKFENVI